MKPKMVYVRWKDANHGLEECRLEDMGLCELEEVGWLVHETEEHVTLTMERLAEHQSPDSARLWLTIPRCNLLEMLPLYVRRPRGATAKPAA